MLFPAPLDKQFYGDPEDQETADDHQKFKLEQTGGEEGQNDAKNNRQTRAGKNASAALVRRKGPHGHGDDDRIVARQQDIDQNYGECVEEESAVDLSHAAIAGYQDGFFLNVNDAGQR